MFPCSYRVSCNANNSTCFNMLPAREPLSGLHLVFRCTIDTLKLYPCTIPQGYPWQSLLEAEQPFLWCDSFPISNVKCTLIMIKPRKGSGGARGDDAANLKPVVVSWIPSILGMPVTVPLSPSSKLDHGFEHDDTGCLLCPIEYNLGDATWVVH